MVMVENATDPHDCFNTEIFLDRDRLIKPALNGQSDTDSKNELALAVSKDKDTRDVEVPQKELSTTSQKVLRLKKMAIPHLQ